MNNTKRHAKWAMFEQNYTITKIECLVVIDAIDKCHYYLHGKQFRVVTYNAALQW